ncbi:MAG: sigma-54 dependent transcriptional regulator [Candidatus Thiodiazotropha sp. (ex Myrtea sp. 'scaly one' KF741663)]|nr:sigma-54 dependent transcriptional regulator [Candidatus Thiodiazotropha sp. (ex Myrtea sp. 'scaly one' KF741663)]
MASVLVVDDEPGIRNFLQRGLAKYFGLVEAAEDVATAEDLRQRCHFDLIITDIRLPGDIGGVEWVKALREQGGSTGVIFMTAHADLETAIAALRAGAEDFILKPFRMEQMMAAVESYLERQKIQRENFVLRRQVDQIYDSAGVVGNCDLMRDLCDVIKRVAPMPSTVLLEGESGTGKELAARAIHELSGRGGSFVPVNCGAMTAELLESELFGHVKGAFTGAHQAREGLFTYAEGGTLFLDEIGEMPLPMQAHLLRALEERAIRPVGSNREIPVDVRIIAATNNHLVDEVSDGSFREDLYYRLNVLSLHIPALRERQEDIPLLANHFIRQLSSELGVEGRELGANEISQLLSYDWPGNVRELKNVIERCLLLNKPPSSCVVGLAYHTKDDVLEDGESLQLDKVEKQHILRVLNMEGGNKSAAARILGISRKTLERKAQAWGLD